MTRRIVRWNPMREMINLRDEVDRLWDQSASMFPRTGWEESGEWGLAVDVAETDDGFTVKASVPGINPDDLEITLTNNILTIKGESKKTDVEETKGYQWKERRYGFFSRTLQLPCRILIDDVKATCEKGLLNIVMPKCKADKTPEIKVKVK